MAHRYPRSCLKMGKDVLGSRVSKLWTTHKVTGQTYSMSKILKAILVLAIVLGSIFSFLMFHTLSLHPDHTQILNKAVRVIEMGEWTHYGNRGTKVGNIPGSFLTAAAAWPMQIFFSPYSAMALIFLFHVLAFVLIYRVGRNFGGAGILLPLSLLFWLNPWRVEQSELYNPAYIFLFSGLHLWTSFKMQEKKFLQTLIHVLCIGFLFQVHFSVLVLGLCSLILWWRKDIKVHWGAVGLGIVLVGLSLVPYFLQIQSQQALQVDLNKETDTFVGRNFLYIYPVIKGILYWFRYGSSYFGRHIFSEVEFSWISYMGLRTAIDVSFHILKWIVAAITLFFSIKWQSQKIKDTWKNRHETTFFWIYFLVLFVSAVLATGLSPVEFNHWHLIVTFPTVALAMSLILSEKMIRLTEKKRALFWALILVVFSVNNIFAAFGSRVHKLGNSYHQQVMEHYQRN